MSRLLLTGPLLCLLGLALSCQRRVSDHGHSEGHDHAHAHDGAATPRENEVDSLAITRWTERYELFVELSAPKPQGKVAYHAHVTRLSDFQPVTAGKLTVRFKRDGRVTAETAIDGVNRAGIFTPAGSAPAAGSYALEIVYEHAGQTDRFDCGTIHVGDGPPAANLAPAAEITFAKETQWKIPFGTAWAEVRDLTGALELAATVEAAGSDQLTLGAPTSGRFFHDRREPLVVGRRVKPGEVLGQVAPNVEGEDFTRLESAVEEAKLQEQQTRVELERVTPLVEQGLLPERRLIELKNELSVRRARLSAAERRVGRVVAPGGAGGLPIRATMQGVLREVLIPNGEPVEAGQVLLRLAGTEHVWLRARFVARPAPELAGAEPIAARLSDGRYIALKGRARFMSTQPIVDPLSRLATWVIDVSPGAPAEADAELRPGAAVVVTIQAGASRKVLAVPRAALVEISTLPYVFVQSGGESFVKRRVEPGRTDGEWVEIHTGLTAGERVVTRGGFDVHVASLGGAVESHRH